MKTIDYNAGETITFGVFINDASTGGPMDMTGLSWRLRIDMAGSPDMSVTGYEVQGEFLNEVAGTPYTRSVLNFDLNPTNVPQVARNFGAYIEVNDGDGWRLWPGGAGRLNVRKIA